MPHLTPPEATLYPLDCDAIRERIDRLDAARNFWQRLLVAAVHLGAYRNTHGDPEPLLSPMPAGTRDVPDLSADEPTPR